MYFFLKSTIWIRSRALAGSIVISWNWQNLSMVASSSVQFVQFSALRRVFFSLYNIGSTIRIENVYVCMYTVYVLSYMYVVTLRNKKSMWKILLLNRTAWWCKRVCKITRGSSCYHIAIKFYSHFAMPPTLQSTLCALWCVIFFASKSILQIVQ